MLYWSSTVPGDTWQYRGVINMFSICQRNAESMTKQWHTLYGYAVHSEMVSWTSPCRVSSSFSSTIYSSLSTTRPRINGPQASVWRTLKTQSQCRSLFLVRRGKGSSLLLQLKLGMAMCFTSESFMLFFLLHCCLNLMGLFRLTILKMDQNRLLT